MRDLTDLNGMTRAEVVPYYVHWMLTQKEPMGDFWTRKNKMIIDKWSNSGLIYIKEQAHKTVNIMRVLSENGYKFLR
jgi:hypothetical protein